MNEWRNLVYVCIHVEIQFGGEDSKFFAHNETIIFSSILINLYKLESYMIKYLINKFIWERPLFDQLLTFCRFDLNLDFCAQDVEKRLRKEFVC